MTTREITRVVAEHYHLSVDKLRINKNTYCAKARHVAMWLCRETLKLSSTEVGRAFERDHTTALGAYKHVEELLGSDPEMQVELALLKAKLGGVAPSVVVVPTTAPMGLDPQTCQHCSQPLLFTRRAELAALSAQLVQVAERLRLLDRP